MPGKVNPVIPEVVSQTSFRVLANDFAVTMAAEAGQLQLNVMEPIITYTLLESQNLLNLSLIHIYDIRFVSKLEFIDRVFLKVNTP